MNLNIEAEPEPEGDPPTFMEKPRIRSENSGQLVIMDCKVKADPKPDVVWYHNGKALSQSSKITWRMEEKEDHYYIRLELKVRRVDFCIASEKNCAEMKYILESVFRIQEKKIKVYTNAI